MVDQIRVKGLKELSQELEQLPKKLQKTAIRRAVAAGAKIILQKAKSSAPRDSGALRRAIARYNRNNRNEPNITRQSIFVRTNRKRTKGQVKRGENPYWWYFQEFGYNAIGRRKFTGRGRQSRDAFRKSAGRFIPETKFMRKAFSTSSGRALVTFRRTLRTELDKYDASRV